MIIDRLIALLGYEMDPGSEEERAKYEQGLEQTTALVGKLVSAAVVGTTAVAGFGGAFVGFSVKLAASEDDLGKWAETANLAVERVESLSYAIQIFGGDQGGLRASLDTLEQLRAGFARGEGDFRLLGEVGVSFEGDALDIADRLAARFQNLSVNEAQDFGRRLGIDRDFVALLQSGTANIAELEQQARELGFVLGAQAKEDSAAFNDEMLRAQGLVDGIKNKIAAGLLPELTRMLESFIKFVQTNREVIESRLTEFLDLSRSLFTALARVVLVTATAFGTLADIVGGVDNAIITLIATYTALRLASAVTTGAMVLNFSRAGAAALLMNAKMLLIPLAIVAAFGLIAAAIEDIYGYFTGKDSVTGLLVEGFQEWKQTLDDTNAPLKTMADILESMVGFVVSIGEGLGIATGAIVEFTTTGKLSDTSKEAIKDQLTPDADNNSAFGLLYRQFTKEPGYQLDPSKGGLAGTSLDSIANFGGRTEVTQKVDVTINGTVDPEPLGVGIGKGATEALPGGRALPPSAVVK